MRDELALTVGSRASTLPFGRAQQGNTEMEPRSPGPSSWLSPQLWTGRCSFFCFLAYGLHTSIFRLSSFVLGNTSCLQVTGCCFQLFLKMTKQIGIWVGGKRRLIGKGHMGTFWGGRNVFSICILVETAQCTHFKKLNNTYT